MTALDWSGYVPQPTTSEARLQRLVIAACHERGLRLFHSTDSRQDIGRGWPDLVIAHPRTCKIIFVELKNTHGQLHGDQFTWKYILIGAGVPWYLWRPSDWDDGTIEHILDNLGDPQ